MVNPRNPRPTLEYGSRLGRLTIGCVVNDVFNHPLYSDTPDGYLTQGRLTEVHCDCGKTKLIPQRILLKRTVKSCGCLRAEILEKGRAKRLAKRIQKRERAFMNLEIQELQIKLNSLQWVDSSIRDHEAINRIAARLRELFQKKELLKLKRIADKYLT